MSQWSVPDFIKEITDLNTLAKSRSSSTIVDRLAANLCTKIQSMDELTPSALVQLSEAISQTTLSDTIKDLLQNAFDEKSLSSSTGALKLVAKSQTLQCIWNYLSEKEYAELVHAPMPTMIQIVCARLKKVGIRSMKEKTKKPVVTFLIHMIVSRGEPEPSPAEVYKLNKLLYNAFQAKVQPPLTHPLATYPAGPHELGEDSCCSLFLLSAFCLFSVRSEYPVG